MKPEYFGQVSPHKAYLIKLRWAIVGLVSIIFVLGLTLFNIAGNSQGNEMPAVNSSVAFAAPTPKVPQIDILIAKERIETGSQLYPALFEIKTVDKDLVSDNVMLAADAHRVGTMFAKEMIPARAFINSSMTAVERPRGPFEIPEGHRATTIVIDARTGVEGFAQPNSRVDILWAFTDKYGDENIKTIVRFAKVLSVGGRTATTSSQNGAAVQNVTSTATLLVTEKDAMVIELARKTGSLSLTLVGNQEAALPDGAIDNSVSFTEISRDGNAPIEDEDKFVKGKLTFTSRGGEKVQFKLKKDRWEPKPQKGLLENTDDTYTQRATMKRQTRRWYEKR